MGGSCTLSSRRHSLYRHSLYRHSFCLLSSKALKVSCFEWHSDSLPYHRTTHLSYIFIFLDIEKKNSEKKKNQMMDLRGVQVQTVSCDNKIGSIVNLLNV